MLTPLLVMALAYAVIFATILIWRMQAALAERRLAVRRMLASETRAS
jgi:hypothetical protein